MPQSLTLEWEIVTVSPQRLQSGLWGYDEGDIAASYSADVYGEKKQVRRPFAHERTPHVAMSVSSRMTGGEAKAYPIVHESYADEIMQQFRASGLNDGYTGKAVKRFGNDCIFGLPVIFRQRPLKKPEIIDLSRRMYAYGGLFAAEAGSYHNLIADWCVKHYETAALRSAFAEELAREDLPQTREGMREWIMRNHVPEVEQLCLL